MTEFLQFLLENSIIIFTQITDLENFFINFPYNVIYILLFYSVFQAMRMLIILLINKQLGFISAKWALPSTDGNKKILILGDSTAVGTGADSIDDTIAGRLMHDFPHSQIINLGKNGGLITDVCHQINTVREQKFDLIIISVGGNDVYNFTSKKSITRDLLTIFDETKQMSNGRVFFLLYNNLGDAPIFPRTIRYILKRRSIYVQSAIEYLAAIKEISVIKIFSDEKNNPFLREPSKFFAKDGIHPSSHGYRIWYHRMWMELVKLGFKL
jgi:lysophospholipase L1-like esterase